MLFEEWPLGVRSFPAISLKTHDRSVIEGSLLHLTEKEAEAQGGQVTCQGSHSNGGGPHPLLGLLTLGVPEGIMGVLGWAVP